MDESTDDAQSRVVSVNQIVGYNLARLRKAGGLTQGYLSEFLWGMTGIRWSKASISAAERSWDGVRVRKFDSDELLALAAALYVPVEALLLPPEEFDASNVRVSMGNGELTWSMNEYANILLLRVSASNDGSGAEYRRRLQDTIDRFGEGQDIADRPSLDREGALRHRRKVLMSRMIALGDMTREMRADIEKINSVLPQEPDEALPERRTDERPESS